MKIIGRSQSYEVPETPPEELTGAQAQVPVRGLLGRRTGAAAMEAYLGPASEQKVNVPPVQGMLLGSRAGHQLRTEAQQAAAADEAAVPLPPIETHATVEQPFAPPTVNGAPHGVLGRRAQ